MNFKSDYAIFLCADNVEPDINYKVSLAKQLPVVNGNQVRVKNVRICTNGGGVYRYVSYQAPASGQFNEFACLVYRGGVNAEVFINISVIDELRDDYLFAALCLEYFLARKGFLILHSSYILYNGKAILFSAPTKTGKSTQADLWRLYKGAMIVNGDRTAIGRAGDECFAYGYPYCGTSKICFNKSALIATVLFISKGNENRIVKEKLSVTVQRFMLNSWMPLWDGSQNPLYASNAIDIAKAVNAFSFECTPDSSAVSYLFEQLKKERIFDE